jgi:hypothetical protein
VGGWETLTGAIAVCCLLNRQLVGIRFKKVKGGITEDTEGAGPLRRNLYDSSVTSVVKSFTSSPQSKAGQLTASVVNTGSPPKL